MWKGQQAPFLALQNQDGVEVALPNLIEKNAILLVFYPGDFTPVCTKQLCNYQDHVNGFEQFGVKVVGISDNSVASHKKFQQAYKIGFPLLSDPGKVVTKLYGCQSLFMMGGTSRAAMIISQKGLILYRYVEPTVLTRRKADELIGIIDDLKVHRLI
jgi:peroxiredoxin Q/BCP